MTLAKRTCDSIEKVWETHKKLHDISIPREHDSQSFENFKKTHDFVVSHNLKDTSYKVQSESQLKNWLCLKAQPGCPVDDKIEKYKFENLNLPDHYDYREKGCVTSVKNQGNCGSCWAFSATGSIEGVRAANDGTLLSFSEQQLVDCSKENHGCNGGIMHTAMGYVIKVGGLQTDSKCPYVGKQQPCSINTPGPGKISSVIFVDDNDSALAEAICKIGPVSIAIDALQPGFMQYHSGIYKSDGSKAVTLNHGVLIVGYGSENGKKYWIVKNSWGQRWGENGYIKVEKNGGGGIGIGQYCVVAKP